MKIFRSIIATTSIVILFLGAVSPALASGISGGAYGNNIRNATPRGFKRSISRARDMLNTQCQHIEDSNEKRRCMMDYRKLIRKDATPVLRNYVEHNREQRGQRCGSLSNLVKRRACMRNARASIPQGNQRTFNKRTRTRAVKKQQEKCREKATSAEKLQCLQSQGRIRTSKINQLIRRNRPTENTPIYNIAPQGLRRNLSRSRDLIKEQCGDILDGNEKRVCIKKFQKKYRGF